MGATLSERGADSFLHRFEGLRGRLPGDAPARQAAAELFRANGLPTVRDEAWRYTSLRPLTEAEFREALTSVEGGALPEMPDFAGPRLVFVDGRLREDLSRRPPGVRVRRFADAPAFDGPARPDQEKVVALNAMLAEDGAVIDVPAGVDGGTVLLVSLAAEAEGRAIAFHPRHRITLEEGARLAVVEVATGGGGRYLHNPVFEVSVAKAATLTHVRLQDESKDAFQLATIYADIAERGMYDAFTLSLGARVARAEFHARLLGPHATVHLNAAQMLAGDQVGDVTTVVAHEAPNCASRQTVKNVLAGKARGVFQGRIEVSRVAQKTDGYQMSQALLLSAEAEIDCKPELQIYADDVKCSHGATVGELDEDQLFYLRARGIPEGEARGMLVRAFLDDAMEAVTHEEARALLERAVERWWQRRTE